MFARLCAKTPVIASSAIDSATCAVASAARKRVTPLADVCLAPYACNASSRARSVVRPRTGRSPTASADATATPIATSAAADAQAHVGSAAAGIPGTRLAPRRVNNATGRLNKAAGSASTSDSASSSEARRPRVAPIDARTAISPRSRRGPDQHEPRDVGAAQEQHDAAHGQQQLEADARPRTSIRCWFARARRARARAISCETPRAAARSTPISSGASTSLRIAR